MSLKTYLQNAVRDLLVWGSFRTNLGEGSPVKEFPSTPLTQAQRNELRDLLRKHVQKPVEVWYDPEEDQLYLRAHDNILRTVTYSDIGAHTDETGAKYYNGGVFEGCGRNPYQYGLRWIGYL